LLFQISSFQLIADDAISTLYLDDAINFALRNNSNISQGMYDLDKAEIDLEMARKAFYPKIDISSSYTRMFFEEEELTAEFDESDIELPDYILENFDMSFLEEISDMLEPDENNYQTGISIEQPVYLGGRLRIGLEQANKGLKAAELQLEQRKSEQALQTIQLYYNTLLAEERLALEKKVVELVKEHRRAAEHSYDQGLTLKTDLLQVEIEERRAVDSLEDAKNSLLIARRYLSNTTGVNLDGRKLEWPDLDIDMLSNLEEHYLLALENRTELKLMDVNKSVLENNFKMEKNSRKPNVVLSGNYQWQGEEFSFDDGVGSITIAGSISIFDKGLSNSNQKKVEKDIAQLELNKSDFEEFLKIEIEELLLKLENNRQNILTEELNLEMAEENLKLANRRFEEGMATNTEVLDAQMLYKQSSLGILQADYQYNNNFFSLLNKTGLLIEYLQNHERWKK
ncbi:MAG: TolC family protein, partial [Halanaerobiales bacterium]